MPNVEYGSENTQASSGHLFNADGAVNEPALIAACRRGNCDALTMLVERYTPDIYAGVASAWQDAAHKACDLDDLVQEVFLIILESPSRRLTCTHDELRDLHGWLRTIAHNFALDKLVSPTVSWPAHDTAPESQPLDEIPHTPRWASTTRQSDSSGRVSAERGRKIRTWQRRNLACHKLSPAWPARRGVGDVRQGT
jgi:DNA-directed RNA polymerase specialized sigma24 family protein